MRKLSTTDAIPAVRLLAEKQGRKKSVHSAFLDLEEAFLTEYIPHEVSWCSLRTYNALEEYIEWIKMINRGAKKHIQCSIGLINEFPIKVGAHKTQFSSLSSITVMDTITNDIQKAAPWNFIFADDVFHAASTGQVLENGVRQMKSPAAAVRSQAERHGIGTPDEPFGEYRRVATESDKLQISDKFR